MTTSYQTTKEGLERMKAELDELTNVRRPEISERIARAKELGDLSENAEYHEAKEAMAFLESRARELHHFIAHAEIVAPVSTERVTLGCKVRCLVKGKEKLFHVVGSNESDPAAGKISNASPLGMALQDKKKGDTFLFEAPSGPLEYTVLEILC